MTWAGGGEFMRIKQISKCVGLKSMLGPPIIDSFVSCTFRDLGPPVLQ